MLTLSPADAEALATRALMACGTSLDNAASTARALVAADIDGQSGHGLSRLPAYAAQVKVGKIDGQAVPSLSRTRVASIHVDAKSGFAYPALDLAIDALPALALEAGVAAFDPFVPGENPAWAGVERCTLEALLATADVISLHTPLTSETRHMIDAKALGTMKPGTIVVNAARGGVLDEAALVEALKAGRLAGAALDVFETEPVTKASGGVFQGVPNLILTPHIVGVTEESNVRVSGVTAQAVLDVLGA